MSIIKKINILSILLTFSIFGQSQYISEIFEYVPAPGQFINVSPWGIGNSPTSLIGVINGTVTLGAYGGYVTFKFDKPVVNCADNPFGIDFTIFGNPLKPPPPPFLNYSTWSEPGIVYVMKDENGNGLPDETWYELAGSDYFFSTSKRNYSVTYFNPNTTTATNVPWTDNEGNTGFIATNAFHTQPYYPMESNFSNINQEKYTLSGSYIKDVIDFSNPMNIKSVKRAFGYADNQIRGVAPFDLPDNPYTQDVENSGGDAFDISWAVDENGNYIDLDVIHFVKVQNANLADAKRLGEISTEITGAIIVKPNNTIEGELDLVVIKDVPLTLKVPNYQLEVCAFNKGRIQRDRAIGWELSNSNASIDNNFMLSVSDTGKLVITAYLIDKPSIRTTIETTVINTDDIDNEYINKQISVFPVPTRDFLFINNIAKANIKILTISGQEVKSMINYSEMEKIDISDLTNGIYMLKVEINGNVITKKIVKM